MAYRLGQWVVRLATGDRVRIVRGYIKDGRERYLILHHGRHLKWVWGEELHE